MAWVNPQTWTAGQIVNAADLNQDIRDNLLALDTHAHGGAIGDGTSSLTPTRMTYTDAVAPAAPGAGLTVIYTTSGAVHYRAGAAGSDVEISDTIHTH